MEVTVREATPADAEEICAVHGAATELARGVYDDAVVDAWARGTEPGDYAVESEDNRFVVADADGRVVGFGELVFDPGEYLEAPADAEVRAVYVHPDAAGEGVGSAVLADLERAARERGIESLGLWASLNAVPFYEARGYERVGERTHEFGGEVEGRAVEMRKEL